MRDTPANCSGAHAMGMNTACRALIGLFAFDSPTLDILERIGTQRRDSLPQARTLSKAGADHWLLSLFFGWSGDCAGKSGTRRSQARRRKCLGCASDSLEDVGGPGPVGSGGLGPRKEKTRGVDGPCRASVIVPVHLRCGLCRVLFRGPCCVRSDGGSQAPCARDRSAVA